MDRSKTYQVAKTGHRYPFLNKLSAAAGVYIYRNSQQTVLYIGKAKNLKNRVSQYFIGLDAVGAKTPVLVRQIASVTVIPTASEFDAIMLEAKLIYNYQPKYNVIAKDDKSPLYIKISLAETWPGISYVRRLRQPAYGMAKEETGDVVFGPFQSGGDARSLMAAIRRVIPFCTQKIRSGRECFYTHLGLCRPCPSYISGLKNPQEIKSLTTEYRRNMLKIRDILAGKSVLVKKYLRKSMQAYAAKEEYEKAARIRDQLQALSNLLERNYDPLTYIKNSVANEVGVNGETRSLTKLLRPYFPELVRIKRIEGIDISNLDGKEAVGSLVVLTGSYAAKDNYRRFRIRTKSSPDDFAMIREVIARRIRHPEWPYPQLFVIDGGKGQVNSAWTVLKENNLRIPVIGLAKREEEIVVPGPEKFTLIKIGKDEPALRLLIRLRDEAHRFAVSYHRKIREKNRQALYKKLPE